MEADEKMVLAGTLRWDREGMGLETITTITCVLPLGILASC